ncbi:WecB/TagA/CpsF family glycosyltransferase, partial [Shewanella sp. C31]|nr:WecB/TagA/CpsF family glycosyltransferase [Shewanella electrica]
IRRKAPDLLLVGMGERQEVFIHRHKPALGARVALGVGGTVDVLAGEAKRPPLWAQRLGLEWRLRVGLDPKRWKRAPRLFRFAYMVLR